MWTNPTRDYASLNGLDPQLQNPGDRYSQHMTWFYIAIGIYLALNFVIAWVSIRPYRIPIFMSPGAIGAPQEDVDLQADGIPIRAWWVEAADAKTVVILGHGYMMNRSELSGEAAWLHHRGISSLVLDFRAHGRSGGKKCGFGFREKAEIVAAVLWVRKRVPGAKIVLMGSSMGSAASAFAASQVQADALILDSCYSQLPEAVLGWWRFLGGKLLMRLLTPTVWIAIPLVGFTPTAADVGVALKSCKMPVLFLHGANDTLALPAEAERNAKMHVGDNQIVWFQGCNHSEARWLQPDRYHDAIRGFLARFSLE